MFIELTLERRKMIKEIKKTTNVSGRFEIRNPNAPAKKNAEPITKDEKETVINFFADFSSNTQLA
jgi:hypothetical protein